MCRVVTAFALILIAASSLAAEEPFSNKSFDDACAEAKKAGKVVMIDFFTTWCGPCKRLDKETWPDKGVREFLANKAVAIRVDAEKDTKLAAKYNIHAYPSIVFAKPDGTEIDRLVGFREPDAFVGDAKDALAGKDSLARAKEQAEKQKGDPMTRMRVGDAYAQKGNYAAALDEYMWCFDHGNENGAGFYGVRLSFLLSRIHDLGGKYPPAIEALKDRRDAAEKVLRESASGEAKPSTDADRPSMWKAITGSGRDPVFEKTSDFSSINRELDDNKRTLQLYDELRAKPRVSERVLDVMFGEIVNELMHARRYDDVAKGIGDAKARIDQRIEMYKMTQAHLAQAKRPDSGGLIAHEKRQVVNDGAMYYEAFLGAHQKKYAEAVADRVLKFDPSADTFEALAKGALRAKAKQDAAPLVARARKELPAAEFARIRSTLDRIPTDD